MASFEYGGLVEQLSAVTTTTGGTTTLTATSQQLQSFTGSFSQTVILPDATTMSVGQKFELYNNCQPYTFTVTAANATAGATYSNNGQVFTVATTISGGTSLLASGTGAPTASGTLTKTSGTGDATITFSTVIEVTSILLTINSNGSASLTTVPQTGSTVIKLIDKTTAAGVWVVNSPNVINGANTTSMTANTVGVVEIKCLSDTIGSGLQIQGTGSAANRGTFLTTRANGDFFLSNSSALNAFYLIGSGSGTLLGCGTTTPVYHLEVNFSDVNTVQTALTANSSTLGLRNVSATAGNFSSLVFQSSQNSTSSGTTAGGSGSVIQGVYDSHTVNAVTGHLSFLTRNAGTLAERVQITATGIGYGVGTPGQSLDVSANARIRGLTTAGPVTTDANGNLSSSATLSLAFGGFGASNASANAAFNSISPITTLGDLIYGGTSGVATRLAGNTTNTMQVLTSTGASGLATAPVYVNTNANSQVSTFVTRDSNSNSGFNNISVRSLLTTSAAGTTTITASSQPINQITGTSTQTVKLPNSVTINPGTQFPIFNRSTGLVTLQDGSAATLITMASGSQATATLMTQSGLAGVWDVSYTLGAAAFAANGRYFSSASTITSSLSTVVYATTGFDAQNAYNNSTGILTIQTTGKYQINAAITTAGTITLNNALDIQIQQTGSSSQISETLTDAGGAMTNLSAYVSDIFNCVAGDTIKVQVSSSATLPTIVSSNSRNYFSWSFLGT